MPENTFHWLVSLLLGVLASLLGIIVGLLVWIFHGVLHRLERLEVDVARLAETFNARLGDVITATLALQLEMHPEWGEAIRNVMARLAKR